MAQVQKSKAAATVVIGGLVTSTLLTLLVLPALYLWIERRKRTGLAPELSGKRTP